MSRELDSYEVPPRCETGLSDPIHTDINLVVDSAITLREPRESDAEELYGLVDSDRGHLGKWLAWVKRQASAEDTRKFIVDARAKTRHGASLTVCIEVGGKIVGAISLGMADETGGQAQMGYWIAAEAKGRGTMTKSCRKLLEYGFESLGLNRVVLFAARENWRSRKLAERLGFAELREASFGDLKGSFGPGLALGPGPGPNETMVLYWLDAAKWQ